MIRSPELTLQRLTRHGSPAYGTRGYCSNDTGQHIVMTTAAADDARFTNQQPAAKSRAQTDFKETVNATQRRKPDPAPQN